MSTPAGLHRGFLLQATYRHAGARPVVHLWGKLESGEPFLVRDRRPRPSFFVEERHGERARELGARAVAAAGRVTFGGEPVVRVEVDRPGDTPPLRNRLQAEGIPTYEADVRFAVRYLIDRGVRGALEIRGEPRPGAGRVVVFDEPEVGPGRSAPRLSVLSIDIETDPQGRRLLSAALHGCGAAEVLLVTPRGWSCPEGAVPVAGESELLAALSRRVRELDPDVLTGWNVEDFDLAVLVRRAAELVVPFEIGRAPGAVRLGRGVGGRFRRTSAVEIPGRVVLDGIQLLRGAFVRMETYSLDAVAREVLGEGKVLGGPARAEEILRAFREDRALFVEYNLADARLVSEILSRLGLVELAVERSLLTGLPPDRVAGSVAAFDFLYLSELGRRGVVAPTARGETPAGEPTAGGHILEPAPGLYRNVVVLDFKSLYPSLIRTFQIDPLGFLPPERSGEETDPIVAPNGAAFRRRPGVLPHLLDELFPRRTEALARGDRVAAHAVKILMNSFFGVLGTPGSRFHDPRLANAITGFGREILLWSKRRVEDRGLSVLYGDTDSLFVASGDTDPEAARALGGRLAASLTADLGSHLARCYRVESRLELELEGLYLKLFFPHLRGGTSGARKRYAGLLAEAGGARVVFTGMEVVRRDWTELAKTVQRELYERFFDDRPVEGYLRSVVADLRAGRLDELLVYRKAVRKAPDAYTATTPPHVAAARKEGRTRPGVVAYVMTRLGPEPVEERRHPLDYEHYVDKQVRPVSEPVLDLLGIDFARAVGDDRQLDLF